MGFSCFALRARISLHGSSMTAKPLRRRPRLLSTAIQIVQEVDHPGGPLLMHRVANFVTVAVEANLCGDEEHLGSEDLRGRTPCSNLTPHISDAPMQPTQNNFMHDGRSLHKGVPSLVEN